MKTSFQHSQAARAAAGFTLVEVVIASGLLLLLTSAVICAFLFGLRLHQTAETKLGASDDARKAVISLTDEIRSAARIQIGSGSASNFTAAATNAPQTGSALQIYSSGDTNTWSRYYCDNDPGSTNYGRLCHVTSADGGLYHVVVPHAVLNTQSLFASEDSHGNTLNNNQNNRVISMNLQLYTVENTLASTNSGANHDFYQLRTRLTRRRLY